MRWVVLVLVAFARVARADEVDDLVTRGEALAKQSEFSSAIEVFKSADALRPRAKPACPDRPRLHPPRGSGRRPSCSSRSAARARDHRRSAAEVDRRGAAAAHGEAHGGRRRGGDDRRHARRCTCADHGVELRARRGIRAAHDSPQAGALMPFGASPPMGYVAGFLARGRRSRRAEPQTVARSTAAVHCSMSRPKRRGERWCHRRRCFTRSTAGAAGVASSATAIILGGRRGRAWRWRRRALRVQAGARSPRRHRRTSSSSTRA